MGTRLDNQSFGIKVKYFCGHSLHATIVKGHTLNADQRFHQLKVFFVRGEIFFTDETRHSVLMAAPFVGLFFLSDWFY